MGCWVNFKIAYRLLCRRSVFPDYLSVSCDCDSSQSTFFTFYILILKMKKTCNLTGETTCIFLIFPITTVQKSMKCETQESEAGCNFFFRKRSSHTIGQDKRTVEPLHFGNSITRTIMPHIHVSLVFPPQKDKMDSIKAFICEASVSVKARFDGTNVPTGKLNNFIRGMFLFYKGNLITENM